MNEEIKLELYKLKEFAYKGNSKDMSYIHVLYSNIENHITNLQQDLEKANDIIEKDRRFYICRMDEYIELKQENEFLKLNNPEQNIEHFRIIKENKRKIDNLRKENEKLKEKINDLEMFKYNTHNDKTKTVSTITKSYKNEYEDYKSRCEQMEKELKLWKKKYGKI